MTARQITAAARAARFTEVNAIPCGDRLIGPALRLAAARLATQGRARRAALPLAGCGN